MSEQVVTSFSRDGAMRFGYHCVETFTRHSNLPMVVYLDEPMPLEGVETRFTADIPHWRDTAAVLPQRREGVRRPDHYTWQARRFAIKPFVWLDAAEHLGQGVMTWFDADTAVTADLPDGLLTDLLGDADVAYLGRGPMHIETGYVGFRIPQALPVLRWCRDVYMRGDFRQWPDGWTDCHVLQRGLRAVPVKARDLTSHLYAGKAHIWPVSPLGPYMTHVKGETMKVAS